MLAQTSKTKTEQTLKQLQKTKKSHKPENWKEAIFHNTTNTYHKTDYGEICKLFI